MLKNKPRWLEFDRPTIADIAVFPYVALVRGGKINLDTYSHVLTWIERVKQLPGYIPMAGL
jgi:glutathione S-transferase